MRAEVVDSHRRTSEQLFQAQKMEAVGQLTGGVAHDFNNILTVVLGNADAIIDDKAAPPHIAKRAQQICDAGLKAAELTRQLLAFSRRQILKPERSDLSDIVASTGQLMRRTLGEHVVIQTVGAGAAMDDQCGSHPGGDLADEPLHQCPRRHADGRADHDRDEERHPRSGLRAQPGRRDCRRRIRDAVGDRHRLRHAARAS